MLFSHSHPIQPRTLGAVEAFAKPGEVNRERPASGLRRHRGPRRSLLGHGAQHGWTVYIDCLDGRMMTSLMSTSAG
jgi:hypothetical protein